MPGSTGHGVSMLSKASLNTSAIRPNSCLVITNGGETWSAVPRSRRVITPRWRIAPTR